MMRAKIALLGVLVLTVSCQGGESPPLSGAEGTAEAGGDIAVIDGRRISARSLEILVDDEEGGKSKQELLDELIITEVLYKRAVAGGYGDSPGFKVAAKQVLVARLLEEAVEKRARPQDIPQGEVAKYYKEKELAFYYTPETRSADHLLVKASSKKWNVYKDKVPEEVSARAQDIALKIRADIVDNGLAAKNADDLNVIKARWEQTLPEELEIVVETLPPFPKREQGERGKPGFMNSMVMPFADAVFASEVGLVTPVTKTRFGFHVIVMTRLVAELRIPIEEAGPGIRTHLATQKRRIMMQVFLDELIHEYGERVAMDVSSLAKAFKRDDVK